LIRELPAGTSFLKKLITIAEFVFIVAPPIQFNIVVWPSSVKLKGDFQQPFCFRKNSANAKACSGRFPARKSTSATFHKWLFRALLM
jgi:hypothetical protein